MWWPTGEAMRLTAGSPSVAGPPTCSIQCAVDRAQRLVGVHHALRLAGGAGREADVRERAGVDVRHAVRGRRGRQRVVGHEVVRRRPVEHDHVLEALHLVAQPAGQRHVVGALAAGRHDERSRPGPPQHEGGVLRPRGERDAGVDGAEAGDREHERAELEPVGDHDRDAVAGSHAEVREAAGEAVGERVELGVRGALAHLRGRAVDRRGGEPVRPRGGGGSQRGVQRLVGPRPARLVGGDELRGQACGGDRCAHRSAPSRRPPASARRLTASRSRRSAG